ncbi:leucine-rich repeat-containing protein 63 [Phodopus roborovskii]|uniref:Lrrc63 protein n=1 Tax=Phodopus roborovskii TaxID=109678 RepID=A0AAU9ZP58_PHORO|nr:leucine-rich repeat-containing protein 63 [Phodopus roborovskii]CAH6824857.1 Lrrc63 [Phodopus roborovskii]
MKRSDCHSLKTLQHPLLLRRPLPPKLPKLPLSKKKVRTATAKELEQSHIRLSGDERVSVKNEEDVAQSQRPISIQSISLDHAHKTRERVVNILPPRGRRSQPIIHWKIPHSAAGSMFIPSCLSASSRVFRKKLRQIRRARRFKKKKHKRDTFFMNKPFCNILILSNQFVKPLPPSYSRLITSRFKTPSAESRRVPKTPDYTQELPLLRDVGEAPLSPIPSTLSIIPEPQWSERPPRPSLPLNKVTLNIATLPATHTLPMPVLPRKPPRQIAIENAVESGKLETPKPSDVLIKTMRKVDPEAHVLRGEGFKTIAATRYETIMAMTTLAIINCQIYGRNALSLKGFFLLHCPDLTPVAFQLIYLNLSFNDLNHFPVDILCLQNLQVLKLRNNPIREIPNEIKKLKYLRSFCIAFNLIRDLPPGLFLLHYLEELDVSYNEIHNIPNEIQKLRSLDKLNVDGNYMTSFPPGILRLNMTKLQFENTFTNSHFWIEYCWNNPQRLTQICSLFIVKNNLHKIYDFIPKKVKRFLRSTSRCDWCHGPKFGEGFRIIRSCDMFGASQIPIMFHVCSPPCYLEIRESSFVLEGFPSRRIALNMDWVKERRVSDVSFYL